MALIADKALETVEMETGSGKQSLAIFALHSGHLFKAI